MAKTLPISFEDAYRGARITFENNTIDVKAHTKDGDILCSENYVPFRISIEEHKIFRIEGNDIICSHNLAPEKNKNCCMEIPHPKGNSIKIQYKNGKKKHIVEGEGLFNPATNSYGSFIIEFNIDPASPKEIPLEVNLKNLLYGCKRFLNYKRKNESSGIENAKICCEIEPGSRDGKVIIIRGEGDYLDNGRRRDLKIILKETDYNGFHRDGDDIHKRVNVVKGSREVRIETLTGRILKEIYAGQQLITIRGEGFPTETDRTRFGNLIIHFKLVENLTGQILEENCEVQNLITIRGGGLATETDSPRFGIYCNEIKKWRSNVWKKFLRIEEISIFIYHVKQFWYIVRHPSLILYVIRTDVQTQTFLQVAVFFVILIKIVSWILYFFIYLCKWNGIVEYKICEELVCILTYIIGMFRMRERYYYKDRGLIWFCNIVFLYRLWNGFNHISLSSWINKLRNR